MIRARIPKLRHIRLFTLAALLCTAAPLSARAGFEWVPPPMAEKPRQPRPPAEIPVPVPLPMNADTTKPAAAPVQTLEAAPLEPLALPPEQARVAAPEILPLPPVLAEEMPPPAPFAPPPAASAPLAATPLEAPLKLAPDVPSMPSQEMHEPAPAAPAMKVRVLTPRPQNASSRRGGEATVFINPFPAGKTPPEAAMPPPPPLETASAGIQAEALSMSVPVAPSMPAPAPASPASEPGAFGEVVGFGSDMPLALALRQVVPPEYAFSFGEGVNPGYRVSWNGGKPWNEVVSEMAASLNLTAQVRGNTVYIEAAV